MRRLPFVVVVASFALLPVISSAADGAVKVEGGLVQGVAEGGLAVYKGIPPPGRDERGLPVPERLDTGDIRH